MNRNSGSPSRDRADREGEGDTSLPLIADPAMGALMGQFLVFAFLMLPALLMLLVALVVHWLARRRRQDPSPDLDQDFALRFRRLENSILDDGER